MWRKESLYTVDGNTTGIVNLENSMEFPPQIKNMCGSASSPALQQTFCRPIMGGVCGLPGPLTTPSAFWICSGHLTRPEQALQLGPHTTSSPIACLTPMCAAFSCTWPSPQLCGVKMHHKSWVRFCSFVGPGIFQLFVIE